MYFEFRNWHAMRSGLMFREPDSISEGHRNIIMIFQSISNFSSEMESGNISPSLIACQLRNSKFLKNSITNILFSTIDY